MLSPMCFFNLWMFITIIPRLITIEVNAYNNHYIQDSEILNYLIVTMIAIVVINITLYIFGGKIVNSKVDALNVSQETNGNIRAKNITAILLFLIGAFSKVYLILKSGGISQIWANISARTFFLRGNGYIDNLEIFMIIGMALALDCFYTQRKRIYLIEFITMLVLGLLLLASFGARAPLLECVIILLFVKHYRSRKIQVSDIFRPNFIILVTLCLLFIVSIPMVRFENGKDLYKDPVLWISTASKDLESVITHISSVDKDIFTYSYFSNNSYWLGSTYKDLVLAPIPSSIYPEKPPVDDGVYLANLIQGYDIKPSVPYAYIPYQSSVPFSNSGLMYANFGLLGVIIGSILLGLVYILAYKQLRSRSFSIYRIVIYSIILIKFQFTNLHIVSVIVPVVLILLSEKVFNGSKNERAVKIRRLHV